MKVLIALFLLALAMPARAAQWRDSPEVAALFHAAGMTGTFVLHDPRSGFDTGHDRVRAETRLLPASTFKIANSLIGLAVGAVANVDEALPYTGPSPSFMPAWERAMGLREAIALSNVPIYQELARRIGLERMRTTLARLDYGNGNTGSVVDRFWLDGPLAISAIEQTRFLDRLAHGRLPLPVSAQAAVREILFQEQSGARRLYAKTGWQNAPGAGVGWWVGWVEEGEWLFPFALNLDIRAPEDAKKRIELGKAALRTLGVY
jgi:beta-lactamase class D